MADKCFDCQYVSAMVDSMLKRAKEAFKDQEGVRNVQFMTWNR
jgi:hypothetical protein